MKKIIAIFIISFFMVLSCENKSGSSYSGNIVSTGNSQSGTIKTNPEGKESGYKKELQWTAYKTDKKVPVTGTFLKISLTNVQENQTFPESLTGAKFYCDGTTTSTGDTARDGTLTTFFFKRLASPDITGYFGKFENNKTSVVIVMDGKSVNKEFSYSVKGDQITLKGSVDILKDFNAQKPFTSLHRACYDLHEGKTWTEVDLVIKITK